MGEPLSKQVEEPSDRAGRNDQRGRGRSIRSRRRCREVKMDVKKKGQGYLLLTSFGRVLAAM